MQAGSLISSDVQAFSSRVLVNGVARPVLSWSFDREISSDLPAGVAGGTGIEQATGLIEWASEDISTGSLNPWNASTGWIPSEGDQLEIFAGDGASEWKQFTGVLGKASGAISGGLQSVIIDSIDDLSARAELPGLVDVMPPTLPTRNWRRFRLTPLWAAMMVLRRAGFYATPAVEVNPAVDVPGFGGMWQYTGSMISCQRNSDPDQAPLTPFSTHIADVYGRYESVNPRTGATRVQLTMQVAAQHNGVASLMAMYGASFVTLRATSTAILFMIGSTTIVSVPRNGAEVAQALFENGVVRLRTSSGQDVTGSGSWTVTALMSEVRIIADASSVVNGFIVSHPGVGEEFRNLSWTQTAHIVNGNMHGPMAGLHSSKSKSVRGVLDEISKSLLWPYWIDENGVMQMIASDVLRAATPVTTMTTLDDIRELSWERDLLGIRNRIMTTFERATVNRRTDYSLPVWESNESVVLQSGEVQASIIDPGQEEWLMVDTAWKTIAEVDQLNKGVGSWLGGVYVDGTTENWTNADGTAQAIYELESIGDGVFKATATALALATGKQVELRTVSEDFTGVTVLRKSWWGKNLPILRAKGRMVTEEESRPSVAAAGKGANLEHHTGLWATGNNPTDETLVVDRITTFLAEQTTKPHPKISSLDVGYDPRLQLGDVIKVASENFLGVNLTCLVTGIRANAGNDGYSMSLSVRVISVEQTFTTWAEWEAAWGSSADYVALETAWAETSTYNDFNNDPLRGS